MCVRLRFNPRGCVWCVAQAGSHTIIDDVHRARGLVAVAGVPMLGNLPVWLEKQLLHGSRLNYPATYPEGAPDGMGGKPRTPGHELIKHPIVQVGVHLGRGHTRPLATGYHSVSTAYRTCYTHVPTYVHT